MKHLKSEAEAINLLRSGGVGVLPTDTVYGLVARAADPKAVARLYALKNRERKPGTVIAASVEQVRQLGIADDVLSRVAPYWPNPLSIVLPLPENRSYLTQGVGDQAIRIPKDKHIRALLEQTGPLLTSSANQPGEPPANNIDEAFAYFGNTVDFYVDGGDMSGRTPSTIARPRPDGSLEILRQGAVKVIQP